MGTAACSGPIRYAVLTGNASTSPEETPRWFLYIIRGLFYCMWPGIRRCGTEGTLQQRVTPCPAVQPRNQPELTALVVQDALWPRVTHPPAVSEPGPSLPPFVAVA